MKQKWTTYIDRLPLKTVFTYRDKLTGNIMKDVKLPAIFLQETDNLIEVLSAAEFSSIGTMEGLIKIIDQILKEHGLDKKKDNRRWLGFPLPMQ